MKSFDSKTNRFKNTKSAIKDVKELKQQLKNIKSTIKELETQKSKHVSAALTGSNDKDAEKVLWQKIKKSDQKILNLKNKLPEIEELIGTGGVPPTTTLLPIAKQIMKETIAELEPGSEKIILNKLPRFYQPPPDFNKNLLRDFFNNPQNANELSDYLRRTNRISLLFQQISQPVLINERENR
ncbi:MAG: hypothetical protein ACQETH_03545 [Candidatus Rifleibacteriota bacterium]